jgi:hypothetical protein
MISYSREVLDWSPRLEKNMSAGKYVRAGSLIDRCKGELLPPAFGTFGQQLRLVSRSTRPT